ncbi:DUF4282 domain-containing protein [Streptosporangium sp. NPDC048047]|uniref:DUF4282 domain-containing protein n=1 Tax=Streptosporangium TaxID=2000 RepID=UPI003438CA13
MTDPHQSQDPQSGHGPYAHDPYQAGQRYGQGGHAQDQGPHAPGRYARSPYPQPDHQDTPKGFLARLFDLSFDRYVTTSIIKVIFIILVVVEVLWALSTLALAFDTGPESGVIALILTPIGLFIAVLLTRVWMELLVVIFKIKEDLGAIRERGGL